MAALKCNSADNRHLPLLLACSHSFCSSCLAVMGRTQKYSGHIKCPECKVSAVRGVAAAEVGTASGVAAAEVGTARGVTAAEVGLNNTTKYMQSGWL